MTRNGGSSLNWGFTSRSIRRSEIPQRPASATARKSRARDTGCPWKLPPGQDVSRVGEDQGIVGGRVQLAGECLPGERHCIADPAVDLRHAAEGIAVLDLSAVLVGDHHLGVLEQEAEVPRRGRLARMGAHRLEAFVEGNLGAAQGLQRHGPCHVGELDQAFGPDERQGADPGHAARAVDQGQPLLGLEGDRGEAGAAQRLGPRQPLPVIPGLALADQDQGQVRQRGEVPARPDGAPLGDDRVHPAVQQLTEQINDFRPDARVSLGEDVGPQEDGGPRLRLADGIADADGVAAEEVPLQGIAVGRAHEDVAQGAEAGADPVDRSFRGQSAPRSRGGPPRPWGGPRDPGPRPRRAWPPAPHRSA